MMYNQTNVDILRLRAELGHQQIAEGKCHTTQEVLQACRNKKIAEAV